MVAVLELGRGPVIVDHVAVGEDLGVRGAREQPVEQGGSLLVPVAAAPGDVSSAEQDERTGARAQAGAGRFIWREGVLAGCRGKQDREERRTGRETTGT